MRGKASGKAGVRKEEVHCAMLGFSMPAHVRLENISSAAAKCVATVGLCASLTVLPQSVLPVHASVITENTLLRRYVVTSGEALLRYSLPLGPAEDKLAVRQLQRALEKLDIDLRSKGFAALRGARKDLGQAQSLLSPGQQANIVLEVPKAKRDAATVEVRAAAEDIERLASELEKELATKKRGSFNRDKLEVLRHSALKHIGNIETMMAPKKLPYKIPSRYDHLPRLTGRAEVELRLRKSGDNVFRDEKNNAMREVTVQAIVDGFSAPLTGGNFVDLVNRGFYNGMKFLVVERGQFVLTGGDKGATIDGKRREVPMEVKIDGDQAPFWGYTLDDSGLKEAQTTIPTSAFGAMALTHSMDNINDGSAQVCFFLLDPRSEAARSRRGNIENGNISNFGYVVENQRYLAQLQKGDEIVYANVISGIDRLVPGRATT